jgi:hypothetical protein
MKEGKEDENDDEEEQNEEAGPSEYTLTKQKNVEELKKIVDNLKTQYSIVDLEPTQVSKKSVSKKKNGANHGTAPRRESQRNKGKRWDAQANARDEANVLFKFCHCGR